MINDVIRQLPKELALQIAAGEVVERPASIVKELVENSLDAGAKNIDIKVQGGGINLIEVLDDGRGIRREELKLSLATHSTSKISTADDLAAITTMGFRGEALASIAAVAKLSISSKHRQEEDAWAIDAAGGKIGDLRPAAQASGTRVQVKDIFYNLPARRKFLRTLATEFHNIEQIFIRLALGNHHISFSLTRDDKIIYKLIARSPASKSEGERQVEGQIEGRGEIEGQVEGEADAYIDVRRIEELINEKVSENFVEVDDDAMGYRLRGWTVSPTYASSRNANQFLYVNGRFVRDKIFSNAVKRGYKERLHGQRTPAYVFYLDLPPTEVDVNVHPAKYEVRFHKGQQIHSLVRKAISKAISKGGDPSKLNHGTYKMNLRTTDAADRSITSQDHLSSSYSAKGELSKGELSKGELSNRGASSLLDNNTKSNLSPEDHTSSSYSQSNLHPDPIKDFNKVREALSSFQETDKIPTKSSGQASLSTMAEFMPALGYAVAQLHGIYIIS
ncbi:MAG: DNA mismatch repair endonuclease MutL, partial [Candidatus Portiera sp.]|nr:DNA mismatch repair endonuclease MutL [Portiera sp.]